MLLDLILCFEGSVFVTRTCCAAGVVLLETSPSVQILGCKLKRRVCAAQMLGAAIAGTSKRCHSDVNTDARRRSALHFP